MKIRLNKSLILEIIRKAIHFSGLLIVLVYTFLLNYFNERIAIITLTAILLILLEIEYLRIEHRPRIMSAFEKLYRKHEKSNLSGAVFIVISCIICFAAFDYWIAALALFMTVFGDIFAAIFGKAFGKKKLYKRKTIAGTLAGFIANFAVGWLTLPVLLIVLPMAIVSTIVELFTRKLDDNLTVPLFSGFIGQMLVYFLGIQLPEVNFSFFGFF